MAFAMFPPESVALVTGASSGIGRAIAFQLVGDGIHSIALLDISSNLAAEEAALKAAYPRVQTLAISVDVTKDTEVDLAIARTVEAFGHIDVAVNAAGVSCASVATAETTTAELDQVIDVNMKGVWYSERAVLKQMMKQELRPVTTGLPLQTRGSIVNVGSIYGSRGLENTGPYAMAKHAVEGMTKVDGLQYATQGVRVNSVSPAFVRTKLLPDESWETDFVKGRIERTPMNRLGLPEEIAYTVSFLASDRATFITGSSIAVDGGYTAA